MPSSLFRAQPEFTQSWRLTRGIVEGYLYPETVAPGQPASTRRTKLVHEELEQVEGASAGTGSVPQLEKVMYDEQTWQKKTKTKMCLAGVAQWIRHWPTNQKVPGSIPSQGTCLGCRPGPQ